MINFKMENYITPIKENYGSSCKSNGRRQGDWICFNCNNLNFSFRKKCNRCKTQTREQNDISPAYQYYYVEPTNQQFSAYHYKERSPLAEQSMNIPSAISTPPREKCIDPYAKADLPSISPLLKKYKASRDSDKKTIPTSEGCDQSYSNIFAENDSFWKSVGIDLNANIRDFEKIYPRGTCCQVYHEDQQEYDIGQADQELERLIGRIIL